MSARKQTKMPTAGASKLTLSYDNDFTKDWPAKTIEYRSVGSLVPYARNARTHSDAQVAQLAASINEWGWTMPILIDEAGGLIAGHGRVLAAQRLGIKDVPTIIARGWSEAKRRAYVIADNRLALGAEWDLAMLSVELSDLEAEAFDMSRIGFSADELAQYGADKTSGLTDPDEVPDVPPRSVTRSGDIWLLGKHRIVCGDSTDAETVEGVLDGVRPHLMVTDPPYGVAYDPAWRNRAGLGNTKRTGKVENDHRADWRDAWALFPGEVAYVWHGALHAAEVAKSLEASGYQIRAQIIWAKERLVMGRGHYHWQHEPCWYAVKGTGHWAGDRKQTTLWPIASKGQDVETEHGTQKPVACMRRPIENNSIPGQSVYEPFSGSGTTIIAAEMAGRTCIAIELSPRYVDVAVLRWQAFTGEQAILQETDRTFTEAACERLEDTP